MLNKLTLGFSLLFILQLSYAGETSHPISLCDEFVSYEDKVKTDTNKLDLKFKKGVLWKIEKDGKVNYLFGTIHSQDYSVSKYPPQVRLALIKSKLLLMETIPDQQANDTFIDMMFFKDGQQLEKLLEPALLTELTNIIKNYDVTEDQVNNIKPWAAFSLIGRPKPVRAPSLESNLLQFAQQHMIETRSLESMEEILLALDGLSMEDQIIILKDTICNHTKIVRETKTLVDLYIARDLEGIVAFNNQPHHDEAVFDRFIQRVLYDRNITMLERIENAFSKGNVFVAVGTSHIADEKGLLNELQKAGHTISVIY